VYDILEFEIFVMIFGSAFLIDTDTDIDPEYSAPPYRCDLVMW